MHFVSISACMKAGCERATPLSTFLFCLSHSLLLLHLLHLLSICTEPQGQQSNNVGIRRAVHSFGLEI